MRPRRLDRLSALGDDAADRIASVRDAADDRLPAGVSPGLLSLRIHTDRGQGALDRIARYRAWDAWHDLGAATVLLLQAGLVPLLALVAARATTRSEPTPVNDPANAVVIPGVNEFMPVAVAGYVVVALVLATAVHEAAHAVAFRREGVRLQEWGVVLLGGVIPLAGYALPGEEIRHASPRSRIRIYSAGVLSNVVLGVVAFAGLLLPATASPVEAYVTYFGWAVVGGAPPTAATVGALGVASNLLFWSAFLNVNLAVTNALPVGILDGGRVLKLVLQETATRFSIPTRAVAGAVTTVGVVTALFVVAALFAPHF